MMPKPGQNPFDFERPVREPDLFFGRRNEARRILRFIGGSQCVSVIGPSKIGKTSILKYVSHPLVLREYGLEESDCLFVPIDCQELADEDREGCLNCIGTQIGRQLIPRCSIAVDHVRSFADLEKICGNLSQSGLRPLVIMLDAVGSLIGNSRLGFHFFVNLRSLNTNFHVAYLTASEEPIEELEQKYFDHMGHTSRFSNIFTPFRLGPLDQDESRALLKRYFALAGLAFRDPATWGAGSKPLQPEGKMTRFFRSVFDASRARLRCHRHLQSSSAARSVDSIVDLIVERTAGHPYLIQWIGWHAVDIWYRNCCRWDDTCRERLLSYLNSLPDV
jgi:hypothetical protein